MHENCIDKFSKEKFLFGANGPFRTQKYIFIILDQLEELDYFEILHNEGDPEVHESYINN